RRKNDTSALVCRGCAHVRQCAALRAHVNPNERRLSGAALLFAAWRLVVGEQARVDDLGERGSVGIRPGSAGLLRLSRCGHLGRGTDRHWRLLSEDGERGGHRTPSNGARTGERPLANTYTRSMPDMHLSVSVSPAGYS